MRTGGYDPGRYGPEVRRGGGLPFGQFVSQWMCDPRYSTNLRTLYGILVTYADVGARDTSRGKPWRAELAAQLGVSEKTLDRTVFEGECAGLWTVQPQIRPVTEGSDPKKVNDANIYVLHDADFWRGEWVDSLEPGQKAADVAKARVSARVEAKRAAGIEPMGGRKKKPQVEGGVTGDATSNEGGGVMGDATPGVTGDATPGVTHDALIKIPVVENPHQEPSSPSVRPSVEEEDARASETDGRTDAVSSEGEQEETRLPTGNTSAGANTEPKNSSNDRGVADPTVGDHRSATPGVEILRRVAQQREELALTGKVLTDQARRLDGLLIASHDAGDPWMPSQLIEILSVPLNGPIRVSPGAVISARITALPITPNAAAGMLPWQATGEDQPPARERSVLTAADRTVNESITRRIRGECPECGADSPGNTMCGDCLGWPKCENGCGRALRDGGVCESCQYAAHHASIKATALEDGTCPGHDSPCGRSVMTLGLCGKCRIKAEAARNAVLTDWEAAKAQMIENAQAVEAERDRQSDHAPF